MSFNFGSTQNTFGSTPKPTAFGAPITFGTPATTASSGFGTFGSSFGTPATQPAPAFGAPSATPAFGSTSFGASTFGTPASSAPAPIFGSSTQAAAPAFGSSTFGAAASTATPAFGASFGATQTSTAPSLFGQTKPSLFGTTNTPSLFSTPATTSSLFGTSTAITTATPSLFGAPTSTTTLFGAPTTSAPNLFGSTFGATPASSAPSLFGSTQPTAAPSTGFNLFGATAASSAPSLFGTTSTNTFGAGFGTSGSAFGGFGGGGLFGAKPQQTQPTSAQQVGDVKAQQTLASFYAITLFGDERDDILKKWNMLQACWGTGKGYYNSGQPPVDYDQCNPFYRFKAISYVVIPNMDNADGLVKLIFSKKESEVNSQRSVVINGLNAVLGNKPNLTVAVVQVKALGETECEVMITVSEKGVTGTSRKIHASDLSAYLNQPTQKQQLAGAGVTLVVPYVMPTKAQLEEYLKEPPTGIDEQMWKAAQIDNPYPNKYIPSPLTGFGNLKRRLICEEQETGLHRGFLDKVDNDIKELRKKHAASIAQIVEQKQKFLQLQHRVLKILVKQESSRKLGIPLQPEEEVLKARLELMHTHLCMSTQYRGKLNELASSTKVMNSYDIGKTESYRLDDQAQENLKHFLTLQQHGITHLIKIINQDMKDLKIIGEGMTQLLAIK